MVVGAHNLRFGDLVFVPDPTDQECCASGQQHAWSVLEVRGAAVSIQGPFGVCLLVLTGRDAVVRYRDPEQGGAP